MLTVCKLKGVFHCASIRQIRASAAVGNPMGGAFHDFHPRGANEKGHVLASRRRVRHRTYRLDPLVAPLLPLTPPSERATPGQGWDLSIAPSNRTMQTARTPTFFTCGSANPEARGFIGPVLTVGTAMANTEGHGS